MANKSNTAGSSKRWCFTLNNYTTEEVDVVDNIAAQYLVYGREVGKKDNTPHLQGYVTFKGPKRLTGVKKLIPRAHWEIAKGTSLEAADYCKKQGDYTEKGTSPTPGQRTDLSSCTDMLKAGKSLKDVAMEHSTTFVKYHRGLRDFALMCQKQYNHDDVRGIWYYGEPGTGKSRAARMEHPGAFLKPQSKWFDGYSGEQSIILDDFDKSGTGLGHHMKIWADRYACTGETKGGTIHLQHTVILVTSNYSIDELWFDDPQMTAALKRRFKVKHFPITPFTRGKRQRHSDNDAPTVEDCDIVN